MKRWALMYVLAGMLLMNANVYAQETAEPVKATSETETMALEINRLTGAGDFQGALDLTNTLLTKQLEPGDRALITLNKGALLGKLGKSEESLQTFDEVLAMNIPEIESYTLETKAIFLSYINRLEESIAIYKSLLAKATVPEEQTRLQGNIDILEKALKDGVTQTNNETPNTP